MKPKNLQYIPVIVSACMLTSCLTERVRMDMGLVSEAFTGPQDDAVIVERGRGLASSAAPTLSAQQGSGFFSQTQPHPQKVYTPTPQINTYTQPVQQQTAVTQTPQTDVAATPQMRQYIVQSGDTLSAIAARYGLTTAQLIRVNNLGASANSLRIGQKLLIPTPGAAVQTPQPAVQQTPQVPVTQSRPVVTPQVQTPVSTSTGYVTYEVKPRDTLSGIAAKHGTTVSQINKLNGFTAEQANRLRVGQTIKLPAK